MKRITVYYNGSGLLVDKEVASLKGLNSGQNITSESEFWDILGANARHGIERINLVKDVEKSN